MEIMRLNGVDARLYPLVGPLVMNPAILRENNNYPFKTSNRYLWYIAISDGVIVGFIPLKKNEKSYHIDNTYKETVRKRLMLCCIVSSTI